MAKIAKKSVTNADRIREILAAEPQTPTREVVEALATKGVKVSPNHVYLIRSKNRKQHRKQKRDQAAAAAARGGMANPLSLLRKVKALAQEAGGYDTIKQLVDVLTS